MKEHPDDCPGDEAHGGDSDGLSDGFIEAALGAYRRGDVDGLRALGTQRAAGEPTPDPSPSKAPTPVPRRFPIEPEHLKYAQATRQALLESFGPEVSPSEKLLVDLIAVELPVHLTLVEAVAQLAARVPRILDDTKHVVTLAKALRALKIVSDSTGRRIENLIGTTVALRAQRRLVELHSGENR